MILGIGSPQLADANEIDGCMDEDRGENGIGAGIRPGQAKTGRQILHKAKQQRLPVMLTDVTEHMDSRKDQDGNKICQTSVLVMQSLEYKATVKNFFRYWYKENYAKSHSRIVVLGHFPNGGVVYVDKVGNDPENEVGKQHR